MWKINDQAKGADGDESCPVRAKCSEQGVLSLSDSGQREGHLCFSLLLIFSFFFFFHFNLQKAFNALCHSTHLYGRRLVLEWADTEETVEALRRRTADHFHGKASSWLLAHPAGTDLLAHSHAAPALPHPEEVGTLWPVSQSIFPIATGGPCTYPQPRPITC